MGLLGDVFYPAEHYDGYRDRWQRFFQTGRGSSYLGLFPIPALDLEAPRQIHMDGRQTI